MTFPWRRSPWIGPSRFSTRYGCFRRRGADRTVGNRYEQTGREICPLEEIRAADAKDAATLTEILGLDTLSVPDKRRRLVRELTPRLTDAYLFVHRDMLNRIFRAALGRSRVGRDIDDEARVVPSHGQLKGQMISWHKQQKTSCGLPTRVSRPKRRMSWSLEHVARLLGSPIYLGTSSRSQRSRKATANKRLIIRDAMYWVPLFMITMGVRPEEILQAAVRDVIRRDGIFCLLLGFEDNSVLKNEQSRRVLPIPQSLLDLGFREWVVEKLKAGDEWLFPEIQPDKSHGRRSQIFGDRLRTILKGLKLHCEREDIYAMRRTLSSKLMHLGIDTGTRQTILGHLEGTTIDRHYSDNGLLELKDILDAVDYGMKVGRDRRFAFPVITGNSNSVLRALDVNLDLTDQGQVSAVQLRDPDTDEIVFEATVSGRRAPTGKGWSDCENLDAKVVATRLSSLGQEYALTLPASEEATAALEHLLILVDERPLNASGTQRMQSDMDDRPDIVSRSDTAPCKPPATVDQRSGRISRGDTVVCVFPSHRSATGTSTPRPGLVVETRNMGGRTYLDIAWGGPLRPSGPASHELALSQQSEITDARLDLPTRFDMRRRVLVPEDDTSLVHGRLGRIGSSVSARLRDCLLQAGDVCPAPIREAQRPARPLTIERRRTKSVRPSSAR